MEVYRKIFSAAKHQNKVINDLYYFIFNFSCLSNFFLYYKFYFIVILIFTVFQLNIKQIAVNKFYKITMPLLTKDFRNLPIYYSTILSEN